MIKRIAIWLMASALASALLTGCAANKPYNVNVNQRDYIDSTQTLMVNTFNGYVFSEYGVVPNDDGTYTVTIIAVPPEANPHRG